MTSAVALLALVSAGVDAGLETPGGLGAFWGFIYMSQLQKSFCNWHAQCLVANHFHILKEIP